MASVDMLQYLTKLNSDGNSHAVVRMEQDVSRAASSVRKSNPGYAGALLKCLAVACTSTGNLDRAIELFQQARSIAQELGVRSEDSMCAGNIGVCYLKLGQYAKALELLESRLRFAKEQGDEDGVSQARINLSTCYQHLG